MAGAADTRPLSPHLQVWRWHVTMLASIAHRATGVALYAAGALLVGWLSLIVAGPEAYARVEAALPSWLIWTVLYAITAAFAYHFANGVRHLLFDMGWATHAKIANSTAWIAILFALAAPFGLIALTGGPG